MSDIDLVHVATEFCRLTGDVISRWQMHKRLTMHWHVGATIRSDRFGLFFWRLNELLLDDLHLSIARLHDPARSFGKDNISIDLIVAHPSLDSDLRRQLLTYLPHMEALTEQARKARHKVLAHNDLTTTTDVINIGWFHQGQDDIYIDNLIKFATLTSERLSSQPFLYDDLSANDIDSVLHVLAIGLDHI